MDLPKINNGDPVAEDKIQSEEVKELKRTATHKGKDDSDNMFSMLLGMPKKPRGDAIGDLHLPLSSQNSVRQVRRSATRRGKNHGKDGHPPPKKERVTKLQKIFRKKVDKLLTPEQKLEQRLAKPNITETDKLKYRMKYREAKRIESRNQEKKELLAVVRERHQIDDQIKKQKSEEALRKLEEKERQAIELRKQQENFLPTKKQSNNEYMMVLFTRMGKVQKVQKSKRGPQTPQQQEA
ncbi:hypothetical protein FGO68_gene12200 [Halteria grandinella]|uniref:Uncharacterized protein n=1 Tax=Halteria grandinella TaxID=5974 RepID=A0A8J8NXQ0_HALGN|nr:hypothetical protein FGO68_gene12200 [Halteria grandinella]